MKHHQRNSNESSKEIQADDDWQLAEKTHMKSEPKYCNYNTTIESTVIAEERSQWSWMSSDEKNNGFPRFVRKAMVEGTVS